MNRQDLISRLARILDPEPFIAGHRQCARCEHDRDTAERRAQQFLELVENELAKR